MSNDAKIILNILLDRGHADLFLGNRQITGAKDLPSRARAIAQICRIPENRKSLLLVVVRTPKGRGISCQLEELQEEAYKINKEIVLTQLPKLAIRLASTRHQSYQAATA